VVLVLLLVAPMLVVLLPLELQLLVLEHYLP
jgi:hypothetical protein